jgi:phosphomannomutase
VPDGKAEHGWRRLTGDQLGLILADAMAARAKAAGRHGALASSIVSSSALAKVAAHYDLDYRETLTGFKWISKVPNLIFGFEEALGYCVDPNQVPDKDGLSAALVIAQLACDLEAKGKTITDHLADLGSIYGHFATGQISIRVTDLAKISELMARLRSTPPKQIAGFEASYSDLLHPLDSSENAGEATGQPALPPTDALRFDLHFNPANAGRVIVRPSGTEPKLKCYLQAVGDSAANAEGNLAELRAAMTTILA